MTHIIETLPLLIFGNINLTLKRLVYFYLLLISCTGFGQGVDCSAPPSTEGYLNTFLSVDQQGASAGSSFSAFLNKLEKKQLSLTQQGDFTRYIFTKTHQYYLKKYEDHASFSALFNKGSYNCLTGTILYSLILNHFHIAHEVIETNYHIFILAETNQGKILLETTDPLHGFVDTPSGIEKRISAYKKNTLYASNSKFNYYQFNTDLFNSVSIEELRGLLFYNKAVDSYNHQNLQESVQYLTKAHTLYSSSRIDEFSQIILLALQQSALENAIKVECIKTVLSIRNELLPVVASLGKN